jgi:hypothetical protein
MEIPEPNQLLAKPSDYISDAGELTASRQPISAVYRRDKMANVKGFAPWHPQKATKEALAEVLDVINSQKEYWPLSQRYWLYRLMGLKGWQKFDEYAGKAGKAHGVDDEGNTFYLPRDSKNLNLILNRGRRARLIPMEAVSSSRGMVKPPSDSGSPEVLADWLHRIADQEQFGRQVGQTRMAVLWMETEGLVDSVAPTAHEYGATVLAGKGFDVLGRKYNFAKQIAEMGDVLILHCGDLDKSGDDVHVSLDEDLQAFIESMGGRMKLKRILLTEAQAYKYELAYTKAASGLNAGNHGKNFTSSIECQLEAMDIKDILENIRHHFELELNMDLLRMRVADEPAKRAEALRLLAA